MLELQFFFIGFIQGFTEFLPISSSAHLILISELTNWEDQGIFTDIAVHTGTLGAVILYLIKDIKEIIIDFFQFQKKNSNFFALKILFATIPAIFVGFLFYEYFLVYFRNLIVIAWASIFFGVILFWADQKKNSTKKWEDLNFYEVILIGLCQIFAFIPGASRAGVTITGARLLGISRKSSAILSMLLSIPIILSSITLVGIDIYNENSYSIDTSKTFTAIIISFITALTSIHFMMKILQKTNFNIFILYRIILGIIILLVIN